jgi:hypothetical protein
MRKLIRSLEVYYIDFGESISLSHISNWEKLLVLNTDLFFISNSTTPEEVTLVEIK